MCERKDGGGRGSRDCLQLSLPLDRVYFVDGADSLKRCRRRLTQVCAACKMCTRVSQLHSNQLCDRSRTHENVYNYSVFCGAEGGINWSRCRVEAPNMQWRGREVCVCVCVLS